jgi:hypothetical protein
MKSIHGSSVYKLRQGWHWHLLAGYGFGSLWAAVHLARSHLTLLFLLSFLEGGGIIMTIRWNDTI